MYSTANLQRAVSEAKAAREERVRRDEERRNAPAVLGDKERQLFAKMGTFPPEQAAGLGFCLEPQEKAVLCEYLFTEAADSEKETLSLALLEDLDVSSSLPIYKQCFEHYDDANFRPMFKKLRASKSFVSSINQHYGIKCEPMLDAMSQGELPEYINNEAGMIASETEGGYAGALAKFGVEEKSELYYRCSELYVVVCNAKEYRKLGANKLMSMTEEFGVDNKTRLLKNMLNVMDDFQLEGFVPMLEDFLSITGDKGSGEYKEALGGVSAGNLKKYDLWTSKYKIRKILGDNIVSKFWYEFAGEAAVSQQPELNTILLDFGKFTVIEILDNEVAYFYDKKYFTETVYTGIAKAHNAQELENWLRENTQWSASGDHQSHWRKAHAGQWQQAFREYIAVNS